MSVLDGLDRQIVAALQEGLPLEERPWEAVARRSGIAAATVKARVQAMLEAGIIRRIAAVPNHYRLGLTANGMSVWDVEDRLVDALGAQVGALSFVSHCYRRPRRLPDWPYNLFAMVHGASREAVKAHVAEIAELLGDAARAHDILFSVRILKKTGLRIAA